MVEPVLELVPNPGVGRRHEARRRARLGDTTPHGRVRLDAIARYLQDIANDDAYTSGIVNPGGWVVRRTTIEVHQPLTFREQLAVTTFCSAIGRSWAERRTDVVGDAGGLVRAAALWVQIEPSTGRPLSLGEDFAAVYGPSAVGRTIRAKRLHPDPPEAVVAAAADGAADGSSGDAFAVARFPLRFADFDVIGHVNNAIYWAMVEEFLVAGQRGGAASGPWRAEVEHRRALERGAEVTVVAGSQALWVFDGSGLVATATAALSAPAAGQVSS